MTCLESSHKIHRMFRLLAVTSCRVLLLAALAAAGTNAQSQVAPSPPQARPQPITLTVDSAPEALVYRFFFGELAASQQEAGELDAQGKDARPLRDRYQRLIGLSAADFEAIRAVASVASDTRADKSRSAALLLKDAQGAQNIQSILPQVVQLSKDAQSAVLDGVGQLRARLGPERFTQLDQRIRRYVVPKLKLYAVGQARPGAPEGGQR